MRDEETGMREMAEEKKRLQGGKSSHELWGRAGGGETAVLLDFLQITRVPLTSPICLDYPDGSGEPRDLKHPRRTLPSSLPAPRSSSFPLTRRNGLDGSQIDIC